MSITIAHPQAVRGLDLNETPACADLALMRAEALPRHLWEPAAGRGAIARELRAAGHIVTTADIVERDFRSTSWRRPEDAEAAGCTAIVTNPPYGRAVLDPFVRHALDLSPRVYLLLRLSFLEGTGRPTSWNRAASRGFTFSAIACRCCTGTIGPDRGHATPSLTAGSCWVRDHSGPRRDPSHLDQSLTTRPPGRGPQRGEADHG